MAKYFVLWEVIPENLPKDPAELGKLFGGFMEIVRKQMAEHKTTDWGIFSGGSAGYAIHEGTPDYSFGIALQYSPYVKFDIRPVLSAAEAVKVMQSMKG
jgi:hypothetical protein